MTIHNVLFFFKGLHIVIFDAVKVLSDFVEPGHDLKRCIIVALFQALDSSKRIGFVYLLFVLVELMDEFFLFPCDLLKISLLEFI